MLTDYLLPSAYGLLVLAVAVALFGDRLPRPQRTVAVFASVCTGSAAVLFGFARPMVFFGDKFYYTLFARFASVGFCILATLWLMWISGRVKGRICEAVALGLLSLIGANVLVCVGEFITFLVALELTAMPSYILLGYWTKKRSGLEAALKYFLFSVLTTLVMSYGISLIYAASGTTIIRSVDLSGAGSLGFTGLIMLMVGMFAKVSAVPFHFWAPDAYSGAPGWSVAFVSTVPKSAVMVALIWIAGLLAGQSETLVLVFAVISGLSMVVGSFAALAQDSVRRIMAYSGVVNTGYLLIALCSLSSMSLIVIIAPLMFVFFYALAVMGVLLITAPEGDLVRDLAGLSKRRPVAAWALALLCLSLVGVPPLAGFFGKFYLFTAGFSSSYWPMVILATVCSVVSAFYYLRLVKTAFFDTPEGEHTSVEGYHISRDLCAAIAIGVIVILVAVLGSLSGFLLQWLTIS